MVSLSRSHIDMYSVSFYKYFFFFKQKTAYEMRISDWSSDVCSSDLSPVTRRQLERQPSDRLEGIAGGSGVGGGGYDTVALKCHRQIGRASCRERVCQYV